MEDSITLTETQVNKLLEYLSKQPYKEVYVLIAMLQAEWDKQHKGE